MDTIYDINLGRDNKKGSYIAEFTLNNNNKKVGALKVLELPRISIPYEKSIISAKNRNYAIDYLTYENSDYYSMEYDIKIPKGNEFVEIPKSKKFSFKEHSYSITYNLIDKTRLKVNIVAQPDLDYNILPQDYNAFKEYVNSVLNANQAYIGFK